MAPFYGWGSTASRLEPLWGGSLLFTTNLPEILGTHFINRQRMKGWVDLGATYDASKSTWIPFLSTSDIFFSSQVIVIFLFKLSVGRHIPFSFDIFDLLCCNCLFLLVQNFWGVELNWNDPQRLINVSLENLYLRSFLLFCTSNLILPLTTQLTFHATFLYCHPGKICFPRQVLFQAISTTGQQ